MELLKGPHCVDDTLPPSRFGYIHLHSRGRLDGNPASHRCNNGVRNTRGETSDPKAVLHSMSLGPFVFELYRSLNVVLMMIISFHLPIVSHSIGAPTGDQLVEIQWESQNGDAVLLSEASGAGVDHTYLLT